MPVVDKPFRLANIRSGYAARWVRRLPGARLVMGLESPGAYWLPLAHGLRRQLRFAGVLVTLLDTHRLVEQVDHTPSNPDAKQARMMARGGRPS